MDASVGIDNYYFFPSSAVKWKVNRHYWFLLLQVHARFPFFQQEQVPCFFVFFHRCLSS